MAFFGLISISYALTLEELVEHLATAPESQQTAVSTKDQTTTLHKLSIQDMDHDEIISSFKDEQTITREQFAYMLDLLTHDIEAIRYIDRCGFRDYEDAESILGLAAVNTLCHKGVVRGTYQRKYYYQAKLTEAEAVTMIVRAKFLEEYDHLRDLENAAPPGQWYRPYYEKAVREQVIIDGVTPYGSLRELTPVVALQLLEHNFGSVNDGVNNNPLSSIIYQTIHDDERAHIVWRVRDVQGRTIHIDDDSVRISLDPYRKVMDDKDVFTSKSCDETGECLTKIEFDIDREQDRNHYCGQMTYTVDIPYTKNVTEDFCLDR